MFLGGILTKFTHTKIIKVPILFLRAYYLSFIYFKWRSNFFLKSIEPSLWRAQKQRYLRWQGCNSDFGPSDVECSDQPVDEVSNGQGVIPSVSHYRYRARGIEGCRLVTTQELFLNACILALRPLTEKFKYVSASLVQQLL